MEMHHWKPFKKAIGEKKGGFEKRKKERKSRVNSLKQFTAAAENASHTQTFPSTSNIIKNTFIDGGKMDQVRKRIK